MVNLKKVVKIGSTKTTNPNKKDQEKYEKKVENMRAACKEFEKEFKEYLDIPKMWQGLLKCYFEKQMAKNRLVSRTSRVLHDMSKKLSKFKHGFDPNKVEDYIKAFDFKAKTANSKDYIKRSAIDDKEVADFFNSDIPNILREKAKREAAFEKILDEAEGIQEQSRKSLKISQEVLDDAKKINMKNRALRASLSKNKKISDEGTRRHTIGVLTGREKSMEVDIKKLAEELKELGNKINKAKKVINSPRSTNKEKEHALSNLENASNESNQATTELKEQIKVVEEIHVEVQEKIEAAEMSPFDEKTKTFTVKTENDFRKVRGYGKKIENVVIEENVKTVGKYAFSHCAALKSVNLVHVTNIENSAFFFCEALENINLENVTTVEKAAFFDCTALKSVDLVHVTNIGDSAFFGCKTLKNINLENVTNIGICAFSDCTSLEIVTLPKNRERAAKIKENILNQTLKNAGDGKNGTIQFINDPEPVKQKK